MITKQQWTCRHHLPAFLPLEPPPLVLTCTDAVGSKLWLAMSTPGTARWPPTEGSKKQREVKTCTAQRNSGQVMPLMAGGAGAEEVRSPPPSHLSSSTVAS